MKLLIYIGLITLSTGLFAQVTEKETDLRKINTDSTDGWKKGGLLTVTFSQVSLTNWAAGGENSFSGNSVINAFGNYKKGKISWDNTIDLGYGIMKQGDQEIRKTDDKIDFSSKFGRKLNETSFAAALLNFKSQFMPGYNYPNDSTVISNFMAPGYLLFAAGYDFKKGDWLSLFLAPVTGKMTFVMDEALSNAGAFGVEPAVINPVDSSVVTPGKKTRSEFGGYFKGAFSKDIMKNVKVSTKIELFTNYLHNPQNIDVYWENTIGMKVNKFITVTIGTTLIYDDDVLIEVKNDDGVATGKGPRTQFKEVFGLGFAYKF
jgi:hypothetical protein